MNENLSRAIQLGFCCDAVANAVFYHNNDQRHRDKLAEALLDLTKAIKADMGQTANVTTPVTTAENPE